jgi:hypothetical protein
LSIASTVRGEVFKQVTLHRDQIHGERNAQFRQVDEHARSSRRLHAANRPRDEAGADCRVDFTGPAHRLDFDLVLQAELFQREQRHRLSLSIPQCA